MAISQISLSFGQSIQSEVDERWTPEDGRYCIGWSHEETNLMHRISEIAHTELNMGVYEDLAGNRYMVKQARIRNTVRMAGSHVDAVKNGGRYDGPAGVIAPLVALYQMQKEGISLNQTVVIPIWRNEESPWVNQFAVGSKLATGQLSSEFLRTAKHSEFYHNTLSWQMQNVLKLDTRSLLRRMESDDPKLFNPKKVDYALETHIEQGSQLEMANKSIGLVTSIRGNLRFPDMITFDGEAGHSGTVPQNERQDAVVAMGLFIANTHKKFTGIYNTAHDIVWSYPQGHDDMGHPTTICKTAKLRPEVRSSELWVLNECANIIKQTAESVSKETGVRITLGRITTQNPVKMSQPLQNSLLNFAQSTGVDAMPLPSGAGHDVQVLAQAGIRSALLFIRHGNNGASHRPDEIMGRDKNDNPYKIGSDFANAAEINMMFLGGKARPSSKNPTDSSSFTDDLQKRGAKLIFAAR